MQLSLVHLQSSYYQTKKKRKKIFFQHQIYIPQHRGYVECWKREKTEAAITQSPLPLQRWEVLPLTFKRSGFTFLPRLQMDRNIHADKHTGKPIRGSHWSPPVQVHYSLSMRETIFSHISLLSCTLLLKHRKESNQILATPGYTTVISCFSR